MKHLCAMYLLIALLAPLAGCVVHDHHYRKHPPGHRVDGPPRCHPSQYWDGTQCRHKGKGHGARKHDG